MGFRSSRHCAVMCITGCLVELCTFPQCALVFPALDVQRGQLCSFLCVLFFPVVCFPPCGKIILIAFYRFGVSCDGFRIHFLSGFLGGFGSIRPLFNPYCVTLHSVLWERSGTRGQSHRKTYRQPTQ